MAFNPFHSMRKNSKAILAVVTIFIMIIFVLGSGLRGGDFFNDVLPNWLGGGKGDRSTVVATAYGKQIHANELGNIRAERNLVNEFILAALGRAHVNQFQEIDSQIQSKRVSPEVAREIQPLIRAKLDAAGLSRDNEQDRLDGYKRYSMMLQQMTDARFGSGGFQRLMQLFRNTKREEQEADYNALVAVLNVISFDHDLQNSQRRGGPFYFNAVGNSSTQDALLFKLLLLEADKMGIQFPRDVVNELFVRETNGFLRQSEVGQIERMIRQTRSPQFTTDVLLDGLTNEFRVRTVVLALMGARDSPPAYLTPYEFFQFYKDNLSESFFNMIRVPVQDFLPRVTEKPTDDELRKLFNAKGPGGQPYKLQEPDPSRDTPGFKEPRKVRLAWIGGDPSLPIYAKNLPVVSAVTQVAAALAPTGGGGVPGAFHAVAPQVAENLPLWEKYQTKLKAQRQLYEQSSFFSNWISDSSIYNPLPIAALVGQLAGPPNPLKDVTARAAALHQAVAVEVRNRARVGLPAVLAPVGVPLDFPLVGLVPAVAAVPAPVPMAAYTALFREELLEQRLTNFFTADMRTFQEKLRKFRTEKGADGKEKKPEEVKAEAERFVAEFAKLRGMRWGAALEPHDKFTIAQDPGLKPLAEKAPVKPGDRPGGEWATTFFSEGQFIPEFNFTIPGRDVPVYDAVWFPGFGGPQPGGPKETSFLAWKIEESPPKTFVSYDAAPASVKERVQAAWKWQKARDLAKAEADRLAEKVRDVAKRQLQQADNRNGFLGEVADLAKQLTMFELPPPGEPGLSVLKFQHSFQPGAPGGYQPYALKPSDNIPYPGNMTQELLSVRDKPLGETLVIADQPKANFFVASLEKKREKDVDEFTLLYGRSNRQLPGDRDTLFQIAQQERALPEARKQVIERIKADAHYTEVEGALKETERSDRE